MGLLRFYKKSQRKVYNRPKWTRQQDVPRIVGRAALYASSTTRDERRVMKFEGAGLAVAGIARIINKIIGKVSPRRQFKPEKPPETFKSEVM